MAPCATAGNIQLAIFFFQAEDGIRDLTVTGVQTCALPISWCGVQPALNATSGPLQCTIPALAPGQSMTIKFKMRAQTLPDKASGGTIYHEDRKSTRLNSSHSQISYAVFCLKKKKKKKNTKSSNKDIDC